MSIPTDLKFTKEHEWIKADGEHFVVGITDHAQDQLGDVVFVELPEVGATFSQGDTFGTVESVKAVSDLFAPVSCEVVAVNENLADAPESVNSSPYGDAWMIKIKPTEPSQLEQLLDASAYEALLD